MGCLLVDCSEIENSYSSVDWLDFFRKSLDAGKEITFISNSYPDSDYSAKLRKDYPDQVKILAANSSISSSYGNAELCIPLSVPILMVGGLIDRSDTLEVILALKEEF